MSLRAACAAAICALATSFAAAQTRALLEDLTIYPDALSMSSGEERVLRVATRSGGVPSRVEWTVSNSDLASLSPSGANTSILGRQLGIVTVSARANGKTAIARVTVFDATELPLGTTRWSVAPIRGLVPRPLLDAVAPDGEDGPDLFQVDADPMKRFAVIRALCQHGALLWQATVRGTPWAGDRFGGLLVKLGKLDEPSRTLARFDRSHTSKPSWRYRASGDIEDFAESEDAIYLVEHKITRAGAVVKDQTGQVAVIDTRSGLERARFPLPLSTSDVGSCARKPVVTRRPSQVGSLGLGADNGVYAELLQVHDSWTRACERGRAMPGRGRFKVSRELQLVRLTKNGIEFVRTLWRTDAQGVDSPERMRAVEDVEPGPVMRTRSGELIALWTHLNVASNTLVGQVQVGRVVRGVVANVVSAGNFRASTRHLRVLLDGYNTPWLYLADGSVLQAIDVAAGKTVWSTATAALPFEAIDDRGIVVEDGARGQMGELNVRGAFVRTFPGAIADARVVIQGNGVVHGVDPRTHAAVEVQEPQYVESGWSVALDLESQYEDARRRFAEWLVDTR